LTAEENVADLLGRESLSEEIKLEMIEGVLTSSGVTS
jgi:hypothetical protein